MSDEARHLQWGAEALWQRLLPLLPGLSVEVVARAESTNTSLLDRARVPHEQRASGPDGNAPRRARRADDLLPCLLVAEHQTHGRGRQGRPWVSAPGASLTFSLALRMAPASWAGLSLAVGAALAEVLDPPAAGATPRIVLKWPNDLWLRDAGGGARKLGGVLIETAGYDAGQRLAVVGVGLNVLPQPAEGLEHGYACVQELDPGAAAPALLARVAEPLVQALQRFEHQGLAPWLAAYARRDVLAGQPVRTTLASCPEGVAEGIAADGALRVRAPDGTLQHIVGGEVSVRLQRAGPGA